MSASSVRGALPSLRSRPSPRGMHAGRVRAVRIALTQTVTRWRDELRAAERHLADAVEAHSALDIELYTDAVE